MDYVDRDISVDPKLVIVTSGFGGVYPADIPIGIVARAWAKRTSTSTRRSRSSPFSTSGCSKK